MLKGQKKGESIYPITRICPKCKKDYTIYKHRRSKLCPSCASSVPKEYSERKGEYFERWFKGLKRHVEEIEELLERRKQ